MIKRMLAILVLLLVVPLQGWAAGGIELEAAAEVEITVRNDQGEEEVRRIDAAMANVAPGDEVIFTTRYVNKSDQPATDVVITNPMPAHMLYVDGSAEGEGTRIELSADGATFAPEGELTVIDAEGKKRPATAEDYTHVRWTFEDSVKAGAEGNVLFRAKVK